MGIAMLTAARLAQIVPVWGHGFRLGTPDHQSGNRPRHAGRDALAAGCHRVSSAAGRLLARLRRKAGVPLHERVSSSPARPRPLRVLRVLEPQQPRAAAGRMVISGRMADVCAELDRLAAAEAATRH